MALGPLIVDTSAYSWAARNNPTAVDRMRRAQALLLPSIALGELLAGFTNGNREAQNRALLHEFLASPRVRVVPTTAETAERYRAIVVTLRRQSTPIPTNDIWIAAVAMEAGVPVLTSDDDFNRVPQIIVDWIPS